MVCLPLPAIAGTVARRVPRQRDGPGQAARESGLSGAVAEVEQIVSPERPDDEAAHEAGGQRGEQDGDHDAQVEGSGIDGAVRPPGEAYHATPDRRRQSIPPSSSAKAAIGSMTNAAVNNVILRRMMFQPSHPLISQGVCRTHPGRILD